MRLAVKVPNVKRIGIAFLTNSFPLSHFFPPFLGGVLLPFLGGVLLPFLGDVLVPFLITSVAFLPASYTPFAAVFVAMLAYFTHMNTRLAMPETTDDTPRTA